MSKPEYIWRMARDETLGTRGRISCEQRKARAHGRDAAFASAWKPAGPNGPTGLPFRDAFPDLGQSGSYEADEVLPKLRSTRKKLAAASLQEIPWISAPSAGLTATGRTEGWPVLHRHLLDTLEIASRGVEGCSSFANHPSPCDSWECSPADPRGPELGTNRVREVDGWALFVMMNGFYLYSFICCSQHTRARNHTHAVARISMQI